MFEHDGVLIRAVERDDLEWMRGVRNRVQMNLTHLAIINQPEQERWFESLPNSSRQYYILYSASIPRIGYVRFDEIDHINRSMRVGGDIAPDCQGRGYGTKMMLLILRYSFAILDLWRVWLLVLETNKTALDIYQKVGFALEGRQREAVYRDGKRVDYLMLSYLRSEYDNRA